MKPKIPDAFAIYIKDQMSEYKNLDANTIYQLVQKLKTQDDISLAEANEICLIENLQSTALASDPSKCDGKLVNALSSWYQVVADKIERGKRGNFIFTVCFNSGLHDKYMSPAQKAIKKHGSFEDLCHIILIDEKTYPSLPLPLKNFFIKYETNLYAMENFRAGIYYYPFKTKTGTYTFSQFMKKFRSIEIVTQSAIKIFAALKSGKTWEEMWTPVQDELKPCVLATFLRRKDLYSAVVVDIRANKFLIFINKERLPIVKAALEIPFENLVKNALSHGIIDKYIAQDIMENRTLLCFPIEEFVDASVEYLDKVTEKKIEWQAAQKAVEREERWLEEIR